MKLIRMIRFSIGTIMMFVVMVAAAMALFVKIQEHTAGVAPGWTFDIPSLFVLAILLTSVALGSWKEHSAVQILLQVTVACFGCLTLIWIAEASYERAVRYWCQATFASTVTVPMLARRFVKTWLPRGPRRNWWKKTCEAIFFSFLTMILVSVGGLFQAAVYTASSALPQLSGMQVTPAAPVPPGSPAQVPQIPHFSDP